MIISWVAEHEHPDQQTLSEEEQPKQNRESNRETQRSSAVPLVYVHCTAQCVFTFHMFKRYCLMKTEGVQNSYQSIYHDKKNFGLNRNKKIFFSLFRVVSVFQNYIETTETNRTVTNRNNLKFSEKYQNMLSIKLI